MSWTGKRLLVLAVTILAAHVFAIFALHTREPLMARMAVTGSPRFGASQFTNAPSEGVNGLNDPLTFAGAHPRGFSAHAWLNHPKMEYASSNRPAPPRFLAYSRPAEQTPAIASTPQVAAPLPFLKASLSNPPPRSLFFVEGGLIGRPLLGAPALPLQFGTDVLSNSVVQIGVQADGYPVSARIVRGSGRRDADLTALQIANSVRFAPRKENSVQWGELVFQWFTAEPPSTNAPAPPK